MAKYQKLVSFVEAHLWNGDTVEARDEFCRNSGFPKWEIRELNGETVMVVALENDKAQSRGAEFATVIRSGDYAVRDASGKYYACRKELFENNYMEVGGELSKTVTDNDAAPWVIQEIIRIEKELSEAKEEIKRLERAAAWRG